MVETNGLSNQTHLRRKAAEAECPLGCEAQLLHGPTERPISSARLRLSRGPTRPTAINLSVTSLPKSAPISGKFAASAAGLPLFRWSFDKLVPAGSRNGVVADSGLL
mmetsp:Transcript_43371/g.85960  ORF Transcript_43371/g.85960 Transcript_43371/m.85960 type:complete len:107 (+) Transcript_43371:91-411(+)